MLKVFLEFLLTEAVFTCHVVVTVQFFRALSFKDLLLYLSINYAHENILNKVDIQGLFWLQTSAYFRKAYMKIVQF